LIRLAWPNLAACATLRRLPHRGPRCDVQVFLAAPAQQDARDLDQAWSVLDDGERAHASGLLQDADRRAYVVSHALARWVLAREVGGGEAAALRFSRTAHGRPELVDRDGQTTLAFRFNLSHTQALVGCAVAGSGPPGLDAVPGPAPDLGFDLEEARTPAPLDVASHYFSRDELAWLHALPAARQHQRFYTLWTLKESYIKGRGLGLALPLDSFTVEPLARGRARLSVHRSAGPDVAPWTLRWWRQGQHLAAVAVRAPSGGLRVQLHPGMRIAGLARPTP
jgi:4'-phosphopantetheinyl transferase